MTTTSDTPSQLVPAEPRGEVEWFELDRVELAAVRHDGITIEQLRDIFDSSFGALRTAIEAGQIDAGWAIAVYHGDPMGTFDLEVAFTLAEPLGAPIDVGDVTIRPSHLAQTAAAGLTHLGGYDGMGETWGKVMNAVLGGGSQPHGGFYEVYVTDPSDGTPEEMRTELIVPIVPAV